MEITINISCMPLKNILEADGCPAKTGEKAAFLHHKYAILSLFLTPQRQRR
ncbi:MAG TPA: hypothetical protein PKM20_08670 [Nitrosomonas sp.]|nr:hypothetical protein [Nitrosomonas sp.]